jgi:hypothetical protein
MILFIKSPTKYYPKAMGKDGGFLTPKAIANRIKSKGLQKLRWYCQMCEKQCRDENGFKVGMQGPGEWMYAQIHDEV